MEIKEKNPPPLTRPKRFLDNFITCRRVLNIMVFLGFMVNYMLRVNLNFAIVDMVPKKNTSGNTNTTTTPTLFNISSTLDGSNLTRVIRSPSNSEYKALLEDYDENEDDDKEEEEARKKRKKNLLGTNVIAPSNGSNANVSGGFQYFGSISSNLNQVKGSSSGNQPTGFQSFSSAFGGNQSGGFTTISSSSGGNQSGRFQLSSQSGGKTQISTGLSESSYSDESAVQQTKVTGVRASSEQDDGNSSSQKVGLSPNSLDDFNTGDKISKDSRILYSEDSDKRPLEVRNAKLDQESQTNSTPAPSKEYLQKPGVQRFEWSESAQGYLIGAFFWGYILTELPGGRLAEVIGARKVFGYATLGASVVTLLTPMFAKIHYSMILINRITLGLFLGPTWPSILPLASKWIPMNERGKFLSNMMASTLGAGFTLPVSGYIIETFSWEYVFYTTGLLGFIWSIMWFLLVFETPADHPRITPEELWYIESNLGLKPSKSPTNNYSIEEKQVAQGLIVHSGDESCLSDNENEQKSSDECRNYSTFTRNGNVTNSNSDIKGSSKDTKSSTDKSNSNTNDTKIMAVSNTTNGDLKTTEKQSDRPKAPWFNIVTSIPVWAFVLTHGASVFGYNTITNQLPTFMNYILNYKIKDNGILSSFPYIGKYIAAVIGGSIADKLLHSSRFSKNFVRKLLTFIGVFIPGCLMLFQIFVGNDKTFSIFVFTAALTANGVVVGGYLGNTLDIAPNFSGTVFGLGNMFSGLSGAVSALLVGYLTDKNQVYRQWQKVFFIVAITYILGALIFLIFGSTDVQPWNHTIDQKKKNEIDSDIDEETGILDSSRRRNSASSAIKSYTEDDWDTSSFLSGLDSASKLRKKCNRKRIRPETETESIASSGKKHLRFEQPQDREVSTLKPLISDQHRESDSDYADIEEKNKKKQLAIEAVKLRKARGEKRNNEDYLSSIRKRASYKEAIENGSHSDYSYDSENKTHSPAMRQNQRKIKNLSDSNESLRTTNRIKKYTGRENNQPESASESNNERKTHNRRHTHKSRKTHDDEDDAENNENENACFSSTKQKRESYSKKQKSSSSKQSTSISTDESDNDADQNSSRKKSKKFQVFDVASSQLGNVTHNIRSKSTKNKENTLKNDPEPSTSSARVTNQD